MSAASKASSAKGKKAAPKKQKKESSSDDSDSDSSVPVIKAKAGKKAPAKKAASSSSGSDSDSSEAKPVKKGKAAPAKKAASSSGSDSDSSDAAPAKKAAPKKKAAASSSGSDSDSGSDSKPAAEEAKAPAEAEEADSGEHAGKTELFVQGLSFDTTEQSLAAHFEPYGELVKCKLMRGKAFIEYNDHACAKKALANTNEKDLDGRSIWVEFSGQAAGGYKPQGGDGGGEATTLFVGNLGFRTTRDSIEYFFTGCGVKDVRIALGEDERPRGFAHVEFESPE